MTYNSYVILDEKIAVMDTVDANFTHEWLDNLDRILEGRKPDYLIVQHMEPDHAANVANFLKVYPETTIVANAKTFTMIQNFFGLDLEGQKLEVTNGGTLNLGNHNLTFVFAPMVHWPEVMMTYDETDKILFSADAFGTFGALNGNLFNDEIDFDRDWLDEARRYYTNIVGKYGMQVQNVLKKAAGLDILMLCPLHGPIWRNNLSYILDKYNTWSKYAPEEKGVMIAAASMYGNTENMAEIFASMLAEAGVKKICFHNISKTHVSELISDTFKYSHIILAAPTYNNGIYPLMDNYLEDMKALSSTKPHVCCTWQRKLGSSIGEANRGKAKRNEKYSSYYRKFCRQICFRKRSIHRLLKELDRKK